MKTTYFSLILVSAFLGGCASSGLKVSTTAKNDPWAFFSPSEATNGYVQFPRSFDALDNHGPYFGYVSDATMACNIARIFLNQMPGSQDVPSSSLEAELKDGIWTVAYYEPHTGPVYPILIEIRQNNGVIIKYENPNA